MEAQLNSETRREALVTQFKMAILSAEKTGIKEHYPDGSVESYLYGEATVSDDIGMSFMLPRSADIKEPVWSAAYVRLVQYNKAPAISAIFRENGKGRIERTLFEDRGEWRKAAEITRDLSTVETERLIAGMRMPRLMVENLRELLTPTEAESAEFASQT